MNNFDPQVSSKRLEVWELQEKGFEEKRKDLEKQTITFLDKMELTKNSFSEMFPIHNLGNELYEEIVFQISEDAFQKDYQNISEVLAGRNILQDYGISTFYKLMDRKNFSAEEIVELKSEFDKLIGIYDSGGKFQLNENEQENGNEEYGANIRRTTQIQIDSVLSLLEDLGKIDKIENDQDSKQNDKINLLLSQIISRNFSGENQNLEKGELIIQQKTTIASLAETIGISREDARSIFDALNPNKKIENIEDTNFAKDFPELCKEDQNGQIPEAMQELSKNYISISHEGETNAQQKESQIRSAIPISVSQLISKSTKDFQKVHSKEINSLTDGIKSGSIENKIEIWKQLFDTFNTQNGAQAMTVASQISIDNINNTYGKALRNAENNGNIEQENGLRERRIIKIVEDLNIDLSNLKPGDLDLEKIQKIYMIDYPDDPNISKKFIQKVVESLGEKIDFTIESL